MERLEASSVAVHETGMKAFQRRLRRRSDFADSGATSSSVCGFIGGLLARLRKACSSGSASKSKVLLGASTLPRERPPGRAELSRVTRSVNPTEKRGSASASTYFLGSTSRNAAELMQNRMPVGSGPSGKT